jgi:hypothetical protein
MPERNKRGIACRHPSHSNTYAYSVPVMADVDMDRSVTSHLPFMTKKAEEEVAKTMKEIESRAVGRVRDAAGS